MRIAPRAVNHRSVAASLVYSAPPCIWRLSVFFAKPEVIITELWNEISVRYLLHSCRDGSLDGWSLTSLFSTNAAISETSYTQRCWTSEETGAVKAETRSWYSTVAAAVLKTNVTSSIVKYTAGCQIHMKLDALMQTEIPVTSGMSNLKGEAELFQYSGLLFHTAGTGFVKYYISLKFSRRLQI